MLESLVFTVSAVYTIQNNLIKHDCWSLLKSNYKAVHLMEIEQCMSANEV